MEIYAEKGVFFMVSEEAYVWVSRPQEVGDEQMRSLELLLDASEIERASKFRFESDRRAYVVAGGSGHQKDIGESRTDGQGGTRGLVASGRHLSRQCRHTSAFLCTRCGRQCSKFQGHLGSTWHGSTVLRASGPRC